WLVLAGFASGLFLVPLYAFLQESAGGHRRGRILAAVGLLDSLAGIGSTLVFVLVASGSTLDWEPPAQLFMLAALTLAMTAYALWHLPHQTACAVMRAFGPIFYRVR